MRFALTALALAVSCSFGCAPSRRMKGPVRVGATSELAFLLRPIADEFTRKTEIPVELSFVASGTAISQLKRGIPFSVYIAGDFEDAKLAVTEAGCVETTLAVFGETRLGLVSGPDSDLDSPKLADVSRAGQFKIAIPDPALSPAGRAARVLLESLNVWGVIEERVVFAESELAAFRLAEEGKVDGAIVPMTLPRGQLGDVRVQELVPGGRTQYTQPRVTAVVCGKGDARVRAQKFVDSLVAPRWRSQFARSGLQEVAAPIRLAPQ